MAEKDIALIAQALSGRRNSSGTFRHIEWVSSGSVPRLHWIHRVSSLECRIYVIKKESWIYFTHVQQLIELIRIDIWNGILNLETNLSNSHFVYWFEFDLSSRYFIKINWQIDFSFYIYFYIFLHLTDITDLTKTISNKINMQYFQNQLLQLWECMRKDRYCIFYYRNSVEIWYSIINVICARFLIKKKKSDKLKLYRIQQINYFQRHWVPDIECN